MNEAKEHGQTHGLDGSLVAPDWPPLSLPELREIFPHFPEAGEPRAILTTSPRPFSAAGIIETTQRRIFVKRHARAVRDAEGLAEEHRFMQHLGASGINVPRVFTTTSGNTALESGDLYGRFHTDS